MSPAEMDSDVEELEALLAEIADAVDDPDLSDADAREEIRDLLGEGNGEDD
jgi:hypothetical protein